MQRSSPAERSSRAFPATSGTAMPRECARERRDWPSTKPAGWSNGSLLRCALAGKNSEHVYGMSESSQRTRAKRFGIEFVFDPGERLLVGKDLASLRLGAEPRRKIGDASDGGIILPTRETNGTQRRITLRESDPEIEGVSALPPALSQR